MPAAPFLRYTPLLMLGIVAGWYLRPPAATAWALWATGLAVLLFSFFSGKQNALGLFAAALILTATGMLRTGRMLEKHPPDFGLRDTTGLRAYQAVLASPVENKPATYRATGRVLSVLTARGWQVARGQVLLFVDKNVPKKPRYGDVLLIAARPEAVEPPQNPAEFDYATYLSYQGIYHQQYLHGEAYALLGHAPPSPLAGRMLGISQAAAQQLHRALPAADEYAVAAAMLLGVRDELDNELLRAYATAGAVHTLSVSGMHVGVLFLLLNFILSLVLRNLPRRQIYTAGVSLLVLWAYAVLTGGSAPVLRATLMFSMFCLANAFRLNSQPLNTLAFSAFVVVFADPLSLFQMGFQLSYLAVGGLVLLYERLNTALHLSDPLAAEAWSLTLTALIAQLLTAPLAIYYFHQFPTYFLLVNPLVMLLSSLGLVAGLLYLCFYWLPGLSGLLAFCCQIGFGGLNRAIAGMENWPAARYGGLWLSTGELWACYGLTGAVCALFLTRNKNWLWVALAPATLLCMSQVYRLAEQRSQRGLVVHHLKKQTALTLFSGRKAVLLADSGVYADVRTQALHLENFWAKAGLAAPATHLRTRTGLPFGTAFGWQGKTVLWLKTDPGRYTLADTLDALLLTHNAARYPLPLLNHLPARRVVLDVTNSRATAARWRAACARQGIACHDVRTQGAWVWQW